MEQHPFLENFPTKHGEKLRLKCGGTSSSNPQERLDEERRRWLRVGLRISQFAVRSSQLGGSLATTTFVWIGLTQPSIAFRSAKFGVALLCDLGVCWALWGACAYPEFMDSWQDRVR